MFHKFKLHISKLLCIFFRQFQNNVENQNKLKKIQICNLKTKDHYNHPT